MPLMCHFSLNGRNASVLHCVGVGAFPAYSGKNEGRNNPGMTHIPEVGPIPAGRYYIVDRLSGGRLATMHDIVDGARGVNKGEWFALYRADEKPDDEMFIQGVKRGAFRLHPAGPFGVSEGCITLVHKGDFARLRRALLATLRMGVPGTSLRAYGTVF